MTGPEIDGVSLDVAGGRRTRVQFVGFLPIPGIQSWELAGERLMMTVITPRRPGVMRERYEARLWQPLKNLGALPPLLLHVWNQAKTRFERSVYLELTGAWDWRQGEEGGISVGEFSLGIHSFRRLEGEGIDWVQYPTPGQRHFSWPDPADTRSWVREREVTSALSFWSVSPHGVMTRIPPEETVFLSSREVVFYPGWQLPPGEQFLAVYSYLSKIECEGYVVR